MPYYDFYYVPTDAALDISPDELQTLQELLESGRFNVYVEIGVGRLGTLCRLAKIVKENGLDCQCIGIDAFGELPKDALGENTHEGDVILLKEAEDFLAAEGFAGTVTLRQGDSSTVLKNILPAMRDDSKLIFIDGNHSYQGCLADLEAVEGYTKPGDVLVFHDTLREQHKDYGRGPRGVIEDRLLGNDRYRMLKMPPPDVKPDDEADTMSVFECVAAKEN